MTRRRQVRIRKRINRLRRSAPWLRKKSRETLYLALRRIAGPVSRTFPERVRRANATLTYAFTDGASHV